MTRTRPPLPTYRECAAACQENLDRALERASRAESLARAAALADVAHWREYRVWYERQVAEGKGDEQISMGGGFGAPEAAPSAPWQWERTFNDLPPQWTEREPGADDDEDAA